MDLEWVWEVIHLTSDDKTHRLDLARQATPRDHARDRADGQLRARRMADYQHLVIILAEHGGTDPLGKLVQPVAERLGIPAALVRRIAQIVDHEVDHHLFFEIARAVHRSDRRPAAQQDRQPDRRSEGRRGDEPCRQPDHPRIDQVEDH